MSVTLHPVTSNNVESIGHDPATNTLHVQFKSGGKYTYDGVDAQKFAAMEAAPRVGKHLHEHIKPHHAAKKVG